MADLKKVSAGARKSAFLRWIYGNLTCFSQEHMQTFGYLAAMLPVVDELYDTEAEKVTALSTYRTFFNTEPQIGTMVVGLTVGLEEARALGIALGLSTGGSVLGPLFYIIAWNLAMYFGMKFAFDQGYELGGSAVEALVGPQSAALRDSIVMVGTIVIGAVAATWINITTALSFQFSADSGLVLQDTLDSIFPKFLEHLLRVAVLVSHDQA